MEFKKVESFDALAEQLHKVERDHHAAVIKQSREAALAASRPLAERIEGDLYVKACIRRGLQFSLLEVKKLTQPIAELVKTTTGERYSTRVWTGQVLSHMNVVPKITTQGRWVGKYFFYPEPVPINRGWTIAEDPFGPDALVDRIDKKDATLLLAQDCRGWEMYLKATFYQNERINRCINEYAAVSKHR